MTERFSAQGSPELWLASSIEALEYLGFKNLKFEPGEKNVSGNRHDNFSIEVLPENKATVLVINADSQEDIDAYKKAVAPILAHLKKQPEKNIYLRLSTPIGESEESLVSYTSPEVPNTVEAIPDVIDEINSTILKTEIPTVTINRPVWYKSTWFVFLIAILCPPLGIYLLWKFKLFYDKDRKIFTAFFVIYTVLWLWLLYTLFFYRSNSMVKETIDDSGNEMEQLDAYWGSEQVSNYISQMPNLINTFDNLEVNGELGSETGNQTAEEVFAQVQGLSEGVLSINSLSETNAAFTLQQKINESAQAFLTAIQSLREAIASGDINKINESLNAWNVAENTYYEINYIYQNAIQMATENTNTQNSDETLQVDETGNDINLLQSQ